MPEDVSTEQPQILQNATVKKAVKRKASGKLRKARPLKNLDIDVLRNRLAELQKRMRTAECKMTLLKEKVVVHEDEVNLRAEIPTETVT
jgi:hypothetical protein